MPGKYDFLTCSFDITLTCTIWMNYIFQYNKIAILYPSKYFKVSIFLHKNFVIT